MHVCVVVRGCVCVCVSVCYLGDVDPALDDAGAEVRPDVAVPQRRAEHARRHGVELGDGGPDGGRAPLLLLLLVPLGPGGAQALVGHHLLEQQLDGAQRERGGGLKYIRR